MGVDTFQYGHDLVGYFVAESTFGTAVKPAATNAFRASAITMGQPVGRAFPNDYRGTRSRVERVTTRTPVQPWTAEGILRPSGSAGTAPDIGDILKHVFGTETVSAGTSVTYSLAKDLTGLSASIYRKLSSIHEGVYGAIVQEFTLEWAGDGFIRWRASGVAKGFLETGNSLADGAEAVGSTSLSVDDADFFTKYSIIQIDSDDNSGAGYQVTAIDYSSNVLTLESSTTWADNATIAPFLPDGTFTGDPLFGTDGTLSLDGGTSNINHLSGSLTLRSGADLFNQEYGTDEASDIVMPNWREVELKLDFLVREDETYLMSHMRRAVSKDIEIAIGSTAGKICTVNCNQAQLDPEPRDSPESEMVRFSTTVVPLATSSGEDELTLVFT